MPPDEITPQARRHTLRLRDYDYALAGAYFATICTYQRACMLGSVTDGQMRVSMLGRVAVICWCELLEHFPAVTLDAFVIMPNHLHGIILLKDTAEYGRQVAGEQGEACLAPTNIHAVGAGYEPNTASAKPLRPPRNERPTLGAVVGSFKAASTRLARQKTETPNLRLWQRNYYEHVIRNETALVRIRQYIEDNPAKWALDRDNPATWR